MLIDFLNFRDLENLVIQSFTLSGFFVIQKLYVKYPKPIDTGRVLFFSLLRLL